MDAIRDADIDPTALAGKRVAILGYGNQGRAQALNLKDSGIDVIVGLRDGSASHDRAKADGISSSSLSQAATSADIVMMLAPDEALAAIYRAIEPSLREGAALGFSHGLAIRFGFIDPRPDLDVLQFVVRWGDRERELTPISLGASVFQFLLTIVTLPIAKLLPPSVLYQPAIGPSPAALVAALGAAAASGVGAYLVWSDRISLHAAAEQQREAEAQS